MIYVLGFAFDYANQQVLLMRKSRPDWMAGKLNAVGGKVKNGETPLEAMTREWVEETGSSSPLWQPTISFGSRDILYCFKGNVLSSDMLDICNNTKDWDEPCAMYWWNDITDEAVPNISWLVPFHRLEMPYHLNDDISPFMETVYEGGETVDLQNNLRLKAERAAKLASDELEILFRVGRYGDAYYFNHTDELCDIITPSELDDDFIQASSVERIAAAVIDDYHRYHEVTA